MANIKQFGIKGIGSTVQFGKSGNKIVYDSGNTALKFTTSDGSTLAKVKGADGSASDEFVTKSQLDSTFVEFTQYIKSTVNYNDGTVNLGNITGNTAVLSVSVTVPSGWTDADSSTTITVGDSGDADRFIRTTDVDLSDAVQFQSDDMHVYSANTTLTATISQGAASAGTAEVLVECVAQSVIPLNYGEVS